MTRIIVTVARPELAKAFALELLRAHGVAGAAILGRRGYYRDSMGAPGRNDRNLYDDAIAVYFPAEGERAEVYQTFNANTDPSREAPGIAVLKPGVWRYQLGIHNLSKPPAERYPALVQADEVTVGRDDRGEDTGWFGINIHRGGYTTTSSLGCQTIWPGQWSAFFKLVRVEMHARALATIPYVLSAREDA
jgi:hypothetical protein